MADSAIEQQEHLLRRKVSRFLMRPAGRRAPLKSVIADISQHEWSAFLFGGVPRDLMRFGVAAPVRDVDIVVDRVSSSDMYAVMSPRVKRRTRFGGLHMEENGWLFDMWPLADTWAFKEALISGKDFERLPRTTFLNVEAVAVELRTKPGRKRGIYSYGFFEAMLTQTVEINLRENPYPALCVVRSLLTANRLGFALGPKLVAYIVDQAARIEIEEMLSVQQSHYGQVFLGQHQLCEWLGIIRSNYRTSKGSNVVLPPKLPLQLAFWNDPSIGR